MDLICYSHLRWNFVYQRPQHLLSRMAGYFRVFYIEEPVFDSDEPRVTKTKNGESIWVVTPHLPPQLSATERDDQLAQLLQALIKEFEIKDFIAWFYTPLALHYTRQTHPQLVIFDCMDELSAFHNAPPALIDAETELLQKADLVFTGGYSLFEAKRNRHHNIHLFPSSIDAAHFEQARNFNYQMDDQANIPGPRIGFFGVVDERMDLDLVHAVAQRRPEWSFVIIGPVVKIDPASLPRLSNIYYLGQKPYAQLPQYVSGWEVAMMPFAINAATRYISPTKTPEYLAAGIPVVSTPIHDVIRTYEPLGLVHIAEDPDSFIEAIEAALVEKNDAWLEKIDAHLAMNSWDTTFNQMMEHISKTLESKGIKTQLLEEQLYV